MKLSGYICVRNAISLDYPVHLAIRSLLPVCDEVVVCDSDSTDGTKRVLQVMQYAYADKLKLINYPWPEPKGDPHWWTTWINFAREHLTHPMQLTLDADEVLDDSRECHEALRGAVEEGACRKFDRLNFWRDPHSLIPEGECCGKQVIRLGPSNLWMPSDEPHHAGELEIVDKAVFHPALRIFHLGFLRRPEAFFRKSKVVQSAFFNGYDDRLVKAEAENLPFWQEGCAFLDRLERYDGSYPEGVKVWLKERGYNV